MRTILHTVDIGAEPATIYQSLRTEDGLAGWWSTRVSAGSAVGDRIHFTFLGDFNPVMEIVASEPDVRVTWRCEAGHDPWEGDTFDFALEARGERTLLFFRQEYATELTDEEYGRYNFNWGYYLRSLKLLCETGEGTPFEPGGDG
jgi:uncharacterized protein YndB with AHSA1/START domain